LEEHRVGSAAGSRECSRCIAVPDRIRGSESFKNFDSFLLDEALKAGAGLINGNAIDVTYGESGKPVIHYHVRGTELRLEAELAVFAARG